MCPTNPYAASKAAAESIVQSYIKSFKMPIIITRGNNVYGPNQYPEKVIPKFIQQLRSGEKITIQGNGTCVRGFLYVNDTVDAFIKILEKGKIGEIYNIGCDEDMEISILDLAKKIMDKKPAKKNSLTGIPDIWSAEIMDVGPGTVVICILFLIYGIVCAPHLLPINKESHCV